MKNKYKNDFVLNMINEYIQQRYCEEDLSKIENFNEAFNDKTQVWVIHHRKETDLNKSRASLIKADLYYNRPAKELIFLTSSEHKKLHAEHKKHLQKTKKKMSNSHKGKKRVWNDESHTKFHYE